MTEPNSTTLSMTLWAPINYIYAVEGGFLTIINTVMVLIVWFTPKFWKQKEYVLLAASMFFDLIFGLTYFLHANRQLFLVAEPIPYSRWECYTVLPSFMFLFITPGVGIIFFVSCFDRLIAVTWPLVYRNLSTRYSFYLGMLVFIPSFIFTVFAGVINFSMRDVKDVTSICAFHQYLTPFSHMVLRTIRLVCSIAGLTIYAFIANKIYKIITNKNTNTKAIRSRTIKMTATFLLLMANQFFLYVLPDCIMFVQHSSSYIFDRQLNLDYILQVVYVCFIHKGVGNSLIIFWTQKELIAVVKESFRSMNTALFYTP